MLTDSAKYKEFGSECLDAIFGKGEVFYPATSVTSPPPITRTGSCSKY